jgi:hypothetical protein
VSAARRARRRSGAVAGAAIALAVPLGLVAVSDARVWALAAVGACVIAGATARWFRRDPVMLLAALWAFQILRTPLAAATQSVPVAGTLIDQLTDVCVLVIVLVVAWDAWSPRAPRRDLRLFAVAFALAACGLAGSVVQHAPLLPTVEGLWLGTKFWLLVAATAAVAWRPGDSDRMLRVMVAFGGAAAALGIVDAVTGGAVADTLHSNLRVTQFGGYRSDAAQSLYAHPNEYSLAMCLLVAVWLARVATKGRVRLRDAALLGLFVVAAVVSLRLKAVLSIAAVFAIVAAVQLVHGRRHAMTVRAAGVLSLVLAFSFMGDVISRQFDTYSGSTYSVRKQLYDAGAQIAANHFPFGVGFGRFGSAPSRETYSTVYDDYGLSRTWGLSRDFPRFITDTSWPSVMGEAGYAGVLVFVAGLLALLKAAVGTLRRARGPDAFAPLALIGVLVVVVVDSVANPSLFSWNTVTAVALVAGATLSQRRAQLAAAAPVPASQQSGASGADGFTTPLPSCHGLAT